MNITYNANDVIPLTSELSSIKQINFQKGDKINATFEIINPEKAYLFFNALPIYIQGKEEKESGLTTIPDNVDIEQNVRDFIDQTGVCLCNKISKYEECKKDIEDCETDFDPNEVIREALKEDINGEKYHCKYVRCDFSDVLPDNIKYAFTRMDPAQINISFTDSDVESPKILEVLRLETANGRPRYNYYINKKGTIYKFFDENLLLYPERYHHRNVSRISILVDSVVFDQKYHGPFGTKTVKDYHPKGRTFDALEKLVADICTRYNKWPFTLNCEKINHTKGINPMPIIFDKRPNFPNNKYYNVDLDYYIGRVPNAQVFITEVEYIMEEGDDDDE